VWGPWLLAQRGVGFYPTYNTGVEKMKKNIWDVRTSPARLLSHPSTCRLSKLNSRSILSFFERVSVWHPHHVPAMDDTAGTETPAALTRNVCHAYAAACRSRDAGLTKHTLARNAPARASILSCATCERRGSVGSRICEKYISHTSQTNISI